MDLNKNLLNIFDASKKTVQAKAKANQIEAKKQLGVLSDVADTSASTTKAIAQKKAFPLWFGAVDKIQNLANIPKMTVDSSPFKFNNLLGQSQGWIPNLWFTTMWTQKVEPTPFTPSMPSITQDAQMIRDDAVSRMWTVDDKVLKIMDTYNIDRNELFDLWKFTRQRLEEAGEDTTGLDDVDIAEYALDTAPEEEKQQYMRSWILGSLQGAGIEWAEKQAQAQARMDTGQQGDLSTELQKTGAGIWWANDLIWDAVVWWVKAIWDIVTWGNREEFVNSVTDKIKDTPLYNDYIKEWLSVLWQGMEQYNQWKKENPVAWANTDALLNVVDLWLNFVWWWVAKKAGQEALESGIVKAGKEWLETAVSTVGKMKIPEVNIKTPNVISNVMKTIDPDIDTLIDKSIKPTVIGKTKNVWEIQNYRTNVKKGMDAVIENKDIIKYKWDDWIYKEWWLPETVEEFAQAIDQSKKAIYEKYNAETQKAGSQWAIVDTTPIVLELQKLDEELAGQIGTKSTRSYIQKQIKEIEEIGWMTPEMAQKNKQFLNNKLQAYYRSPNPNEIGNVLVDALINNNLWKFLDDTIMWALDNPQYRRLKDQYGSLSSIEKDVVKRALVNSRKNTKWLVDFTDVMFAWDIATSLLTWDPVSALKWLAWFWLKEWYKFLNNVDNNVKSLFKKYSKNVTTTTDNISDGMSDNLPALPQRRAVDYAYSPKKTTPTDLWSNLDKQGRVIKPYTARDVLEQVRAKKDKNNLSSKIDTIKAKDNQNIATNKTEALKKELKWIQSDTLVSKSDGMSNPIEIYRWTNKWWTKKFWFDAYTDDQNIAKTYWEDIEKKLITPKKLADFSNPKDDLLQIIKDNWEWWKYYDLDRLKKLATKEKMWWMDFYEIFDDKNVIKALSDKWYDVVKFNDFAGSKWNFAKHTTYIELNNKPSIWDKLDSLKANKELQPLYDEAKKYKSADEFIQSKWKPLYHGTTSKFDEFKSEYIWKATDPWIVGKWFYFTNNRRFAEWYAKWDNWNIINSYISTDNLFDMKTLKNQEQAAKLFNMNENDFYRAKDWKIIPKNFKVANIFGEKLKDLWYDGAYFDRYAWSIETVKFDPKNIKTESQLRKIREEANNK